jgi:hypothetical protein
VKEPIPILTKEHGVWVLYTGAPLSPAIVEGVIRDAREERDLANLE